MDAGDRLERTTEHRISLTDCKAVEKVKYNSFFLPEGSGGDLVIE